MARAGDPPVLRWLLRMAEARRLGFAPGQRVGERCDA
jgi:hypothetical protein